MKTKQILVLTALSVFSSILYVEAEIPEENLFKWERFCEYRVEGNVTLLSTTNRQMRSACFTNVFHSLSTNGFKMVDFVERQVGNNLELQVQGADYIVENSNIRFEVAYFTSTNKATGGLVRLIGLTSGYSNMSGKLFQQYTEGSGNVCLLPILANVAEPTTIQDAFFCRDNVAVRVRNLHGGDILAFIKLLDACILASSVE
ncbi:MAG: hypothetical protein FWH21_00305 [Kiritimatiellaeota bacterium]|nr:hypothetical protein [Kiritimatiellota bacterium]